VLRDTLFSLNCDEHPWGRKTELNRFRFKSCQAREKNSQGQKVECIVKKVVIDMNWQDKERSEH
jgi:hypothetical protein